MKKYLYHIQGMHCKSCEIMIEKNIGKISGVKRVEVSHRTGVAEVEFADAPAGTELIARAVRDAGYSLGRSARPPFFTKNGRDYGEVVLGIAALAALYIVARATGITEAFGAGFSAAPTYPIVFVIGLTAGISTCMAIVGGLVAGFSASYAEHHQGATRWERFQPNIYFNAGRLGSYALFGGVIGTFGSFFKIATGATGFLILAAGFVMLYMGLKLTGISPRLSRASIAIPKKLSRALGLTKDRDGYSHKEAALGGAFTFFLPCGFTQAMQLYAITSGSFVTGAVIMSLFALGTMPGLMGIGAITSLLQGRTGKMFFRFIGVVVVALGILNIGNGYALSGLAVPFPSFASWTESAPAAIAPVENGEQVVSMIQVANGYRPNRFTVKKGIPVRWVIDSQNSYTCAASIRMPAQNIAQFLTSGTNTIRFTPKEAGTLRFTCGMGMYSGSFAVVE